MERYLRENAESFITWKFIPLALIFFEWQRCIKISGYLNFIPAAICNVIVSIVQGRSENSHYFGLFNIILSQISPEIISIIRDASQLSGIMTKPSRIRFFFEKWLFLVKLQPIKVSACYLPTCPVMRHNSYVFISLILLLDFIDHFRSSLHLHFWSSCIEIKRIRHTLFPLYWCHVFNCS